MKRSTTLLAAAACTVALATSAALLSAAPPAGAAGTAQAAPAAGPAARAADDPLRLVLPRRVTARRSGTSGALTIHPRLRIVAQGAPLEAWSRRASRGAPIVTELRSAAGNVTLPAGTQKRLSDLSALVRLQIRKDGKVMRTRFLSPCLNSWESQRVTPEAPIRSPYPESCGTGRWTQGFVTGVQSGWSSQTDYVAPQVRLRPGEYEVIAQLANPYAAALGMQATRGRRTFTLVVPPPRKAARSTTSPRAVPREAPDPGLVPHAQEPTQDRAGAPTGPMPDLRSIPAWGIRVSPNGNYLQFSATVWNAGSSPLVVDGFRRKGEAVMDAYQYFIDQDGNQAGYQRVGEMEWDDKDTHQHWHFRDFARYRLLDADQQGVVRSRKEAFCLANTDVIDYTVPGADWQPDGTDLHTSCGGRGSLSLREVLSSGSGDTYAQFRAGQSFSLKGLANGVYYIAVEANPVSRLVEQATDNNRALRKVTIGGKPGARTVKVGPAS